jgi:hypothetical protein
MAGPPSLAALTTTARSTITADKPTLGEEWPPDHSPPRKGGRRHPADRRYLRHVEEPGSSDHRALPGPPPTTRSRPGMYPANPSRTKHCGPVPFHVKRHRAAGSGQRAAGSGQRSDFDTPPFHVKRQTVHGDPSGSGRPTDRRPDSNRRRTCTGRQTSTPFAQPKGTIDSTVHPYSVQRTFPAHPSLAPATPVRWPPGDATPTSPPALAISASFEEPADAPPPLVATSTSTRDGIDPVPH